VSVGDGARITVLVDVVVGVAVGPDDGVAAFVSGGEVWAQVIADAKASAEIAPKRRTASSLRLFSAAAVVPLPVKADLPWHKGYVSRSGVNRGSLVRCRRILTNGLAATY